MYNNDYQKNDDFKKTDNVYQGVAVSDVPNKESGAPVKAGHQRFYCEKCQTPYDLPQGATSWRCQSCMTFNSTTPPECPCCNIQ